MPKPMSPRLPPALKESEIQRQIKDYLQWRGWFVVKIHQSLGSYRGIADLYAIREGRSVWIEVKTSIGRLSMHQERYRADMSILWPGLWMMWNIWGGVADVKTDAIPPTAGSYISPRLAALERARGRPAPTEKGRPGRDAGPAAIRSHADRRHRGPGPGRGAGAGWRYKGGLKTGGWRMGVYDGDGR